MTVPTIQQDPERSYLTFHEFVRQTCKESGRYRYTCGEDTAYQAMQVASQLGAKRDDRDDNYVLDFEGAGGETFSVDIYREGDQGEECELDFTRKLVIDDYKPTHSPVRVIHESEFRAEVEAEEAAKAKAEQVSKGKGKLFYGLIIGGSLIIVLVGAGVAFWLWKKKKAKAAEEGAK